MKSPSSFEFITKEQAAVFDLHKWSTHAGVIIITTGNINIPGVARAPNKPGTNLNNTPVRPRSACR